MNSTVPTAGSDIATSTETTGTNAVSSLLRIVRLLAITVALLVGFGVASASAATAHADAVAGNSVFGAEVECGGDQIFFTVNSDEIEGSYAKLWVYDPATAEWVTDDIWVEADYYATFNIADLTFEPGYYMVFVSYASGTAMIATTPASTSTATISSTPTTTTRRPASATWASTCLRTSDQHTPGNPGRRPADRDSWRLPPSVVDQPPVGLGSASRAFSTTSLSAG